MKTPVGAGIEAKAAPPRATTSAASATAMAGDGRRRVIRDMGHLPCVMTPGPHPAFLPRATRFRLDGLTREAARALLALSTLLVAALRAPPSRPHRGWRLQGQVGQPFPWR